MIYELANKRSNRIAENKSKATFDDSEKNIPMIILFLREENSIFR